MRTVVDSGDRRDGRRRGDRPARRRQGRVLRAAAHASNPSFRSSAIDRQARDRALNRALRMRPRCVEHGAPGAALLRRSRRAPRCCRSIAVPLRMKQRLLGFIAVQLITGGKTLRRGPAQAAQHRRLARRGGDRERRLYEDLQATFQQTIQGLANAIDKMDRYTAGHSERVATYAHAARDAARPLAERDRDRPPVRVDARHRQDRLRAEPEQAGQAHRTRSTRSSRSTRATVATSWSRSSSCIR